MCIRAAKRALNCLHLDLDLNMKKKFFSYLSHCLCGFITLYVPNPKLYIPVCATISKQTAWPTFKILIEVAYPGRSSGKYRQICRDLLNKQDFLWWWQCSVSVPYVSILYGKLWPHAAIECLKCGWYHWGIEFLFYLILTNFSLNSHKWLVATILESVVLDNERKLWITPELVSMWKPEINRRDMESRIKSSIHFLPQFKRSEDSGNIGLNSFTQ